MNALCDEHAAQWSAWSDYRMVLPFRINSGSSSDDSIRGVRQRKRRQVDDWRETIRFQQTLIRTICAKHCSSAIGEAPSPDTAGEVAA